MSGKNCFREKWSVDPSYSGGPISSCILETKPVRSLVGDASLETVKSEVLLAACGSTFNVLDPATGAKLASFTPPSEDVILNVAGIYVSSLEGDEGRPAGSYAAFSTRALALYVLRVEQRVDTEEFSANVDEEGEEGDNVISAKRFVYGSSLTLSVVRTWTASQHAISHLSFSSCGRYLVTCSTAGNVKAWNVFQHHLTHNMDAVGHGVITTAAFSPEVDAATKTPKYLAVGNAEGLITVFDFGGEKRPVAAGQLHVAGIEGIIFVPGDKDAARQIVTVGKDRKIVIATSDLTKVVGGKKKGVAPAEIVQDRAIAIPEHLSCAVFDGYSLLHIGTEDGTVACYAIDLEGKIVRLRRTEPRTAEDQGAVEELDELFVRSVVVSKLRASLSEDAALHEDSGEVRLFVADAAFTISQYEAFASSKVLTKRHTLVAYLDQILDIKLAPSGNTSSLSERPRLVVTNSKDVRIFDQRGCVSSKVLQGHTDIVMCCAISQCGTYAATGSKDQTVRLWDLGTQRCIATSSNAKADPTGHSGVIQSVCFSRRPTDTFHMLYSVGQDEALKSWDVAQIVGGSAMSARHSIASAHDGPIHVVAVAPNDAFLATGGKDKCVNVWNVNGKKVYKEASMKGHKRAVSALCFSPSDRIVASASSDGTIRLWSLASFSCLRTLQQEDKHPVLQCHFFNNGLQIVSSDAVGKVQVWGVATSDVIATLPLHTDKCWALAVVESETDTLFFSGAADGTMKVSEDFTAEEAARVRDEFTETILKEQALANALRREEFAEAFMLALRLNHPRHLRQVIVKWCAKGEDAAHDSLVDSILPGLDDEHLSRLLEFTREWVTNARFCLTATFVLNAMFSAFHFSKLQALRGMRTTLEALTAYSAKHSVRMNKVLQRLYFVDYLCRHIHPKELTTTSTTAQIGEKRPREVDPQTE